MGELIEHADKIEVIVVAGVHGTDLGPGAAFPSI